MNYRALGKTGLNVSEVGMGTWKIAGNPWGLMQEFAKHSWERNFYPDVDPALEQCGYIER
ncbi:hypothetical protein HY623_02945 [Candidatus Uhrbacteria bacterium]|nr:hypothetical protein [Candidatus Uhrbacteria bacterium]